MLKNIKNIIFDFGGVIINLDYQYLYKSFMKIGVDNCQELFSESAQIKVFDDFEEGRISPAQFRDKMREISGVMFSDKEFDNAWNDLLKNIPQNRLEVIYKLKQNYRTFLLSNTNKIHYDCYKNDIREINEFNGFEELFEKTYFSHQIGIKKPNKEIFELVLNENNLIPEETLFIDDTKTHLVSAEKLGIKTHYLRNGEDIDCLFISAF